MAHAPFRGQLTDQLLKGNILMCQRPGYPILQLRKGFGKGVIAIDPGTNNQRVDKKANQRLQFLSITARHRRANTKIPLTAHPVQKCCKSRQQNGIRGAPVLPGQLVNPLMQLPIKGKHYPCSLAAEGSRAGEIRGQFQNLWHPFQLAAPVIELRIQVPACQPLPLPGRVIHILYLQFRQGSRNSFDSFPIQRREFLQKHTHRPSIGDDVMKNHQQHMLLLTQFHNNGTEQGPGAQVKPTGGFRF